MSRFAPNGREHFYRPMQTLLTFRAEQILFLEDFQFGDIFGFAAMEFCRHLGTPHIPPDIYWLDENDINWTLPRADISWEGEGVRRLNALSIFITVTGTDAFN